MSYSQTYRQELAQRILKVTKPDQEIGMLKLSSLTKLTRGPLDAGLYWIRQQGLATTKPRRGHPQGTLITFHKEAVEQELRDKLTTRNRNSASNGVFKVARTFVVEGGTYTAGELEKLARAVLRELD